MRQNPPIHRPASQDHGQGCKWRWTQILSALLLVCALLPLSPRSVHAESIELVEEPALAGLRGQIESYLPLSGNQGSADLVSLTWDTESTELTGVAMLTARHVWTEGDEPAPEALARRTVTFVYNVGQGYLVGDARLEALRLATERNGRLYEFTTEPAVVDLVAIEGLLREHLLAILALLPPQAGVALERRNELEAVRQALVNVHGARNLFFPSESFVEWAGTANLPDWVLTGPVSEEPGLSRLMQSARTQALGEVGPLTSWLRERGVSNAGLTALQLLNGSRASWPDLELHWTTVTYEERAVVREAQLVPWRAAPHGLFYVRWTGRDSTPAPEEGLPTTSATQDGSLATIRTGSAAGLNVRAAPVETADLIGRVANGERFPVVEQSDDGAWLRLDIPALGQTGWVFGRFVELSPGTPVPAAPVENPTPPAAPVEAVALPTSTPVVPPDPTVGQPAPQPVPVAQGRIAVPVYDPGSKQYNIWVAPVANPNPGLLVYDASQPAFSRDGTRIAYRSWLPEDRGILIADGNGANPLRYTSFLEDGLPSWSPNGQRLTFSSYREVDRKPRLYYLWTDPYWSRPENRQDWVFRREPESVYGEDPFWTNDGAIAYVRRTYHPQAELTVMDENAWSHNVIFQDPTLRGPVVSPAGNQIAFMSRRDGDWEIYLVDRSGQNLRRLTSRAGHDGLPAWSPDGRALAYVREQNGVWAVWTMDASGADPRQLFLLPGTLDGRVRDEPDYLTGGWLEEQISWGP